MSVPDSSLLDVTGDIDIRVKAGLTSWASGAEQRLVSKFATGQGSYSLSLQGNGTLLLTWYSDGTTGFTATSTASVAFNAGQTGWVRVALDVDNGASGNTTTFYTSTDGVNWTALGAPVVQAFIAVIHAGTANVGIGASSSGTAVLATGKFYQVQILNGIDGTYALNANMTNVSFSATSFTDSTNQTITINGARLTAQDVDNLGSAGALLPTTVGSSLAADSNDAKFLAHDGTNYVYTPGVASNFLSVPDETALDITGDIDVRVRVALDDWTPSSINSIFNKWTAAGAQQSWFLYVLTDGTLRFSWSTTGSDTLDAVSTVATGIADGAVKWIRATLDVNNGASGRDIKFFTSDNGTTWTQLGSTVTQAGTTSIFSSTSGLQLGAISSTSFPVAGKFYRAQIFSDITETTKVLDVDTSVITAGSATSFTAVTGQTVTINRSSSGRKTVAVTQPTWLFGTDDYMEVNNRYMAHTGSNYMYLPGIASNYASAPDSAALDITGDIDLRCKVALDDWTPSAAMALISKATSATPTQFSYQLIVTTTGALSFNFSLTGSLVLNATSSAVNTFVDGSTNWVRVTRASATGDVIFYTSSDGITWTQLGTTQTTTLGSLYSGTAILEIGTRYVGTSSPARGNFFRAQVLNGIGGTVAFDANFESSITSLNQASFTESSSNAATVTINRSGSTYRSAGVIAAGYLYPGATNTFSNSTIDYLNFGATDSFTVLAIVRNWATAPTGTVIAKNTSLGTATVGYALYNTSTLAAFRIVGPSGTTELRTAAISSGTLQSFITTRDTVADTISLTYNSTTTSIADPSSSLSNLDEFRIGRLSGSGTSYNDMEVVAVAVLRQVLTTAQIRQITNYFANREVYL